MDVLFPEVWCNIIWTIILFSLGVCTRTIKETFITNIIITKHTQNSVSSIYNKLVHMARMAPTYLFMNGCGDLYHSIGTRTMKQDVGSGVHNHSLRIDSCCDRYQPFPPYLSVVLNPASLSKIRKYMYSSNLSIPFMITIIYFKYLCCVLYYIVVLI